VQGVKVTPQVLQFLAIGETRRVSVTVAPSNATDQAIVWESTDSSVASVDSLGVVTARAAGDGIFITAYTHDGLHQASVTVSVLPYVAVQGVKVTPQVIVFDAIGQTKLVVATVVPSNATDQVVTWESTDSTVATVDSSGLVTAKAVGFGVFITAFTRDGLRQASVNVSVDPVVPPPGAGRGFTR
jgi:uncharacterized protein YjdB